MEDFRAKERKIKDEHLMPEKQEVLKEWGGCVSKEHKSSLKLTPADQSWDKLITAIYSIVLIIEVIQGQPWIRKEIKSSNVKYTNKLKVCEEWNIYMISKYFPSKHLLVTKG